MNNVFRKSVILCTAISIVLAAVMCCCLTNPAQADEPVPSCHQASQETEPAHNTDECDCDQSKAIVKKDAVLNLALTEAAPAAADQAADRYVAAPSLIVSYQALPQYYDTSPLYIKHSILRI